MSEPETDLCRKPIGNRLHRNVSIGRQGSNTFDVRQCIDFRRKLILNQKCQGKKNTVSMLKWKSKNSMVTFHA